MHALTRLSLDHPRLTVAALMLVSALLASGLPRLQHAYGYTAIIGLDHPAIVTLRDMVDQFGGGIPARIHWECGPGLPCASVSDHASLAMAASVSAQLMTVDGIRDVYGIASTGLLVASPEGFSVRRFVERGQPVDDAAELARIAAVDPIWADSLVSRDLRAATLFVVPRELDHASELAVVSAIEDALAPFRARGFDFYLVGGPVDGVVAGRDLSESTARIIPFTILLTGLVLFVLYRSWLDVALSLGCMGIALLWTYGLLAWLGWPQDGILQVLAPLIMVVGVCDAVHVMSRYAERCAQDAAHTLNARRAHLLEVAREVAAPCCITTATTAAAFLSFTASNLASFQRFGAISAFGVLACLLLSFTLLPILAAWLPARERARATGLRTHQAWDTALHWLLGLAEQRTRAVLAASAVLLGVGALGWYGHLRVDTNWDDSLGEQSGLVRARQFEVRHHFGTNELELEVTLPADSPVESPDTLARIAAFEAAAAALPMVLETKSILALISHLNRLVHDDDPAYQRPGDSAAANAEILELIAFDDPDILGVWLSFDRTRLRITTQNAAGSAQQQGEALRAIRALAHDHLGPDWRVRMSGDSAVNYEWTSEVQLTQVRSFPIALALVFAIVAIFFRSLGLAAAAMIPAVLPIVVTLGAMGWAGLSLDMGRAMIAAILLGIAVDDSIHVLRHYQVRRRVGDDPTAAIRAAVLHVGRAIVTTSLSLSLGFLTLAASAWQSIASFGLFVSLAILAALAAALVVLPALVVACDPLRGRKGGMMDASTRDDWKVAALKGKRPDPV